MLKPALLPLILALALPVFAADSLQDKKISYSSGRKSVQYIVIDLANLAGVGYNWQKSYAQTNPACRRFVENVSIHDEPFEGDQGHTRPGRIELPLGGWLRNSVSTVGPSGEEPFTPKQNHS
jgi:hypothetical protein